MKAKNYRIGNLVKYDNRVFEIDTIAKVFPTLNTTEFGIGVVDWDNIKPIILTEKWLIKFGFEKQRFCAKKGIQCQYKKNKIKLDISNSGIVYLSYKNTPLNSVHQLQNLYFALTQKELTL